MDSHGIATYVLSVSTLGVHLGNDTEARKWARDVNEYTADLVRADPDRFGLFATLTLPDVEGAIAEAEYALDTLHDALGAPEPDRAWSRKLGAAAMELLWALAADAPAVVIEANFRPYNQYERAKLSGLAAHPVEVHCACPAELAVKRYNARATHPVHVVTTLQLEAMAQYDRPVGIGALVTADTTVPVDVTAVAAAVRGCYDR